MIISLLCLTAVFQAAAVDIRAIKSPLDPYDVTLQAELCQSARTIADALAFIDKMEHPCNWEAEYPIVSGLIAEHNLKTGVEVGVAYGGQSEHILKNTNVERLVSIDPYYHFKTGYADVMNFQQPVFDVLYIKTLKRLEPYGDRSFFLRMASQEASELFEDGCLDFAYIDGNHSYDAAAADIKCWWRTVRSKGLLIGDDYRVFPEVCRAITEFCIREGLFLNTKGNKWWVIKP